MTVYANEANYKLVRRNTNTIIRNTQWRRQDFRTGRAWGRA